MTTTELTIKEETFIQLLLENKGSISKAAEAAGFAPAYGYALRKRLAKHITEAALDHLSLNAVKAAVKLTDSIDEEMPNPNRIQAANSVLDRVGIVKKEGNVTTTVKQNIFILPEKREIIIEND